MSKMKRKQHKRSLEELRARARPALEYPELFDIARSANSPNQAYDRAVIMTGDAGLARACRFLRMIKRDYGNKAFADTVPSVDFDSPRSQGTGAKKGNIIMEKAFLQKLLPALGDNVVLGRHALFLLEGMKEPFGLPGVRLPSIMSLIGEGTETVLGMEFQRSPIDECPIAGIFPVKMLWERDETIRIMVSYPLKAGEKITLVTTSSGQDADVSHVELDSMGCCLHLVRGLPEGDYKVTIDGTEISSQFTVAQYRLSALHAAYESPPTMIKDGKKVKFSASLTSFGNPVHGQVTVQIMQGQKKHTSKKFDSHEGLVVAQLPLPKGDEVLTVNFLWNGRSATLPIRGGKESERTPFIANPLGKVVEISTMAPGKRVRGLFLNNGPANTEPFGLESVVSGPAPYFTGRIIVRSEKVQLARMVVIDPVKREVVSDADMLLGKSQPNDFMVPDPYAIVYIAAVINGKPYEAYAMAIRQPDLEVETNISPQAAPGEEVAVTVTTNKPEERVAVLVTATDGRAVMPSTAQKDFAACIKSGAEKIVGDLKPGPVDNQIEFDGGLLSATLSFLRQRRPQTYSMIDGGNRPTIFGAAASCFPEDEYRPRGIEGIRATMQANPPATLDATIEPIDEIGEVIGDIDGDYPEAGFDMKSFVDKHATGQSTSASGGQAEAGLAVKTRPRQKRPEVVYCELHHVTGSETITFKAPDSITTLNVAIQAIHGFNVAVEERQIEVTKPVWCEFDVPRFVSSGDMAVGRLETGCTSGHLAVEQCSVNGDEVYLFLDQQLKYPWNPDDERGALVGNFTLFFEAVPGKYEATVSDGEGNDDCVKAVVDEPGKLTYITRTLTILRPGQRIAVNDEPGIQALSILPSIKKQADVTVRAITEYGHSCCEQTATSIATNVLVFMGGNDGQKRNAEPAIIAGVRRMETMFSRDKGFFTYPETRHFNEQWSAMATERLLLTLTPLSKMKGLSSPLMEAALSGIRMADNAASVHDIRQFPPREIKTCRDAYAKICTEANDTTQFGHVDQRSLVNFVLSRLNDAGNGRMAVAGHEGNIVERRAETAYAAAVLLLSVSSNNTTQAIMAANYVMSQMTEGRMYSTVDSFALIAMLGALSSSGVILSEESTGNKVAINGSNMTVAEALEYDGYIQVIAYPKDCQGMLAVQVVRRREEDWSTFESGAGVSVGLREPGNGKYIKELRTGQELELVLKIADGYQTGDLFWVCLPDSLSFVFGGGQVKMKSFDPRGRNEVVVPVAVTGDASSGKQNYAVSLRNMFREERAGNPGLQNVMVSAS